MTPGIKIVIATALAFTAVGALSVAVSQEASAPQIVTRDADDTLHIQNGAIPSSSIESEGAKALLARPPAGAAGGRRGGPANDAAAEAAPAAPLGMAEQRLRAYENAKPRIQHMVDLYPVDIEETFLGGISVAVVTPKGGVPAANKNRVMLNVGGGGFRTNNRSVGLFVSIPVASLGKMKVVTASYRQAPEYRFPAATEDFTKVYKELLKSYKPENVGMFGCSAGGALIAEAVAYFQKAGLPAPGVLGLYCSGAGGRFDGDFELFLKFDLAGKGTRCANRNGDVCEGRLFRRHGYEPDRHFPRPGFGDTEEIPPYITGNRHKRFCHEHGGLYPPSSCGRGGGHAVVDI